MDFNLLHIQFRTNFFSSDRLGDKSVYNVQERKFRHKDHRNYAIQVGIKQLGTVLVFKSMAGCVGKPNTSTNYQSKPSNMKNHLCSVDRELASSYIAKSSKRVKQYT